MAQTYRNMSLGSSLTAQNDNSASWQSPSGEFAFGFRQIGNDGFLLAIWFNKIPDKTVVWSANGNSLVAQGSKVELTADGQLLLNDIATGKDTLVTSVGTGVVAYAAMLETGNFVLANAHSNSLWESFGHPTDTILPTQTINQGSRLYAPYTLTNYSRGRFLLTLESDGNLKLYTTNFPQDYPYYGCWNYNDTLHSGFQVVLPYTFSNQDLYQRATLDYDGVLRYYVFRKSNDSSGGTWSALSFIPSNICMSIVQKQGGGACGFNSLCNQNQGRPICQCPSGYTLMDPHDALKGCKPNFVPHSCDGGSSEGDLFYMQEMQNANWQASQYDEFYGVTEDWCRQACLADCLCDVANYRISLCFLKAIPLLNGRIDPSYNGKAFIKIRKGNSTLGSDGAAKTKRKKEYDSTLIVAGSVLLSSSLTAQNDNSSWRSPSGDFAFGFRQIGNNGFLLAIWFDKIPEKTIVWSANGKNLVPHGSKVELTAEGQFSLSDIATGKSTWIASAAGTGVAHAAMLDTGNFVLATSNSSSLWESFSHPTDTILPSQTLNQGSRLYAHYTSTNYSRGRFMFAVQKIGNLVLYTTNFPQDYSYFGYWNYIDTLGRGFQVVFNRSGSVYLTDKNGAILNVVLSSMFSNQDLYQRATLDYDGVLRHYVFRKNNGSSGGTWSTLSFIPSNICMSILQPKGGGTCGFNSLCKHDQGRPVCQCPPGYTYMDPDDMLKGCKPNFAPQSCDEASSESDLFYMQEMQNAYWRANEYDKFQDITEDWCRQTCLADCFCAVAGFRTGNCWLKGGPLLNGRIDANYSGKVLIKIRKDKSTSRSAGAAKNKKKKEYDSTLIVVGSVLLSSLGVLNFILPLITYMVVSRIYSRKAKVIPPYRVMAGMNLKCFTYDEIKDATDKFKEELGRDGSGGVETTVPSSMNAYSNRMPNKLISFDLHPLPLR
ncbi:unnamed protein product [Malus baccata var. baccata]